MILIRACQEIEAIAVTSRGNRLGMCQQVCIGDEWVGRYEDRRWHVVELFQQDDQTFNFIEGVYTGSPGEVLIADVSRLIDKRVVLVSILFQYYTRVRRGRKQCQLYPCAAMP